MEGQMNPKEPSRRRFLKNSAALAGLAVGASATASSVAAEAPVANIDELHKHGERSHFVDSIRRGSINNPERRLPDEPRAFGLTTPLQDSTGMITPASLHYVISHAYNPKAIDPKAHRFSV